MFNILLYLTSSWRPNLSTLADVCQTKLCLKLTQEVGKYVTFFHSSQTPQDFVFKVPPDDFLKSCRLHSPHDYYCFQLTFLRGFTIKELGRVIIKRVLENTMVAPFSWMDSEMMDFF